MVLGQVLDVGMSLHASPIYGNSARHRLQYIFLPHS